MTVDPAAALEFRGIDKWFGSNHANRAVSFKVSPGTIHGLVGENGAGKSTAMNIAYGAIRPDHGELWVAGRRLSPASPRDALAAGIGMVHQHFKMVETFTVLENLLLGVEGGPGLASALRRARRDVERLQSEIGLPVPLEVPVGDLPVGLRQRVEILKALYRGAQLLILDEPTAVLTTDETDHLFQLLRALKNRGGTVILISHKLREIAALTDQVTVMRAGRVVANRATAATTLDQLAELMVGRRVSSQINRKPAHPGRPVLTVESLAVADADGRMRVEDASFTVRSGEIVGIAGITGNGQTELLQALAGLRPVCAGTIQVNGELVASAKFPGSGPAMRRRRVAHVPEDRQRDGLIASFSVAETGILGYHEDKAYNYRFLINQAAIIAGSRRRIAAYQIEPNDPTGRTGDLSGGNQQKLILAREIERGPALLLVGQPTRGVDIGAIELIHRRLIDLRDQGGAIVLVSADLDELLALSDRILGMAGGRLVGEVPAVAADLRKLGRMMAGIAEP